MATKKSTLPGPKTRTTPSPDAPDRPDDDHTDRRIRAYLASVRPLRGSSDEDDNYYRGRSLIERLALSAVDTGMPTLKLTVVDCANVLHFVHGSEPMEPWAWWKDPEHGPSHLCGFSLVIEAVEDSLRSGAAYRRTREVLS